VDTKLTSGHSGQSGHRATSGDYNHVILTSRCAAAAAATHCLSTESSVSSDVTSDDLYARDVSSQLLTQAALAAC